MNKKLFSFVVLAVSILILLLAACGQIGQHETTAPMDADDEWRIRTLDAEGNEAYSFTEKELYAVLQGSVITPQGTPAQYSHIYSTINNWPTVRFYVAEGFSVASILSLAGLYDTAQTVAFKGSDGYEVSLTREQLLSPRYYYPHVGEDDSDAEQVYALVAWRWKEGTADMATLRKEKPCLIIGQGNPFEHTNPAFVENLSEIVVSEAPCEQWSPATTFPLPGLIAAGETVKLQHPDYGLVKIHYSLDGSEPTLLSHMYNPSTYQPELNVPIPVHEQIEIKALVSGYGKADSEIATFVFSVAE